jgi:hypothetical protein
MLNLVDMTTLQTVEEGLAFWLNVFHLLEIVSLVECFPSSPKDRVKNAKNCGFYVGGERISMMQIEFSILRCSQSLPCLPQTLVANHMPKRHALFGNLLDQSEFLAKVVTFGISYLCPGSPGVQVYTAANVKEEILDNGGRYMEAAGMLVSSKKQVVVISSYLEWFQTEADSNNLQLALSNWLHLIGPKFDQSLKMNKDETFKFKFEDNVMLDECVFRFRPESGTEMKDGLHKSQK